MYFKISFAISKNAVNLLIFLLLVRNMDTEMSSTYVFFVFPESTGVFEMRHADILVSITFRKHYSLTTKPYQVFTGTS